MNRYFRLMPGIIALVVAVTIWAAAFWGGCSNKENPVKPTAAQIELLTIICKPLAPAPGDTAQLTTQPVLVRNKKEVQEPGANPTFEWHVDGGTLIDNGTINVRWLIPHEKGVYRVSVRVATGTAIDTMSTYIMVRDIEAINTGIRYSYCPRVSDADFVFIGVRAVPPINGFPGYNVYRLVPFEQITKNSFPSADGGYSFTFFERDVLASVITGGTPSLRQEPMNVIKFPLSGGTKIYVSNNDNEGSTFRKNQHVNPSASDDLTQFVWQYNKVGPSEDGKKDLVNVLYRRVIDPRPTPLTISKDSTYKYGWMYRYYSNIRPMFTSDASKILYFCDSTKTHKKTAPFPGFEPCIIPVDDTGPRTDLRREVGGPESTGTGPFYKNNIKISDKTIFQWNPVVPTEVGFIDDTGKFCLLDCALERVEIGSSMGKIKEFAWSDDGKVAAITSSGAVLITTPGGAPDTVFVRERSGDDVIGVNWSSGTTDQRLAFRIVRKGVSSVEMFAAIVIYSADSHRWYYASPRISAGAEPNVSYPWLRAVFFGDEVYMPVPVSDGGGSVVIYRSY